MRIHEISPAMTLLGIALSCALLTACSSKSVEPTVRAETLCQPKPRPRAARYAKLNLVVDPSYAKHLEAAHERPLGPTRTEDIEIYRWMLLPPGEGATILTLERQADAYSLRRTRLDGRGGAAPGNILDTSTLKVGEHDWLQVLDVLDQSNFWGMTTLEALNAHADAVREAECGPPRPPRIVGTLLIVEGSKATQWHAIDRDLSRTTLSEAWTFLSSLD